MSEQPQLKPQFRLVVDVNRCVGHGRCYDVAPYLFAPEDDEGHACVLTATVPDDQLQAAQEAVHSCPEAAITLTELGPARRNGDAVSVRRRS